MRYFAATNRGNHLGLQTAATNRAARRKHRDLPAVKRISQNGEIALETTACHGQPNTVRRLEPKVHLKSINEMIEHETRIIDAQHRLPWLILVNGEFLKWSGSDSVKVRLAAWHRFDSNAVSVCHKFRDQFD